MIKDNRDMVQAVPLIEGKVNVGAGDYVANSLIHCETAGSITFGPDNVPYDFQAGADRAFTGEFTVVSGTFTYD